LSPPSDGVSTHDGTSRFFADLLADSFLLVQNTIRKSLFRNTLTLKLLESRLTPKIVLSS